MALDEHAAVTPDVVDRLRAALGAADFTHDAVTELLGPVAHAALGRNETVPGLRRTREPSPLATLTRLWLLQAPVVTEAADRALPGLVEPLVALGLLDRSGGEVRARVDVRPYATGERHLWVASDLTPGLDGTPGAVAHDHVIGVSPASTSLAQLTVRRPAGRALDLGTGCGVQALHLAAHAQHVVATDVNPRALRLAGLNAALNEVSLDLREGSLFAPVTGERFDQVVSNPPFVISPATEPRLVYRDSGLPGDRLVEQIVREVPDHLADGGLAQVLADWLVLEGRPWEERVAGWVHGCDAWVVQREFVDLPTYVELWLKDSGAHPATGGDIEGYRRRYDGWLAWLEETGATGVGFGWINLRRTDGTPRLRLEDWPWEVEQPIGPELAAGFERVAALAGIDDDELGASRLLVRADVVQETHGDPGAEDPREVVLRQLRLLRRARRADTVEAALVGACDGELSVDQVLGALADLLERDVDELRAAYLPVVRDLVAEGFLELGR